MSDLDQTIALARARVAAMSLEEVRSYVAEHSNGVVATGLREAAAFLNKQSEKDALEGA